MALQYSQIVLIIIIIATLTAVKSELLYHICDTKNNFTDNSLYQDNLKTVESSLVTSIIQSGFFSTTAGNSSDQVFGLALCRGDVTADVCRSCLVSTIDGASSMCPYGKEEIIWYEQCFLHYSSTNFFGTVGNLSKYYCNPYDVGNPQHYSDILGQLMTKLASRAVSNASRMFATGQMNIDSSINLYGLVQCTRDLSVHDCSLCLQNFISEIPHYCFGKNGARFLGTSCSIRFESLMFYIDTENPAVPPSDNGGNDKARRMGILVGAPVGASVLILITICVCLRWRQRKRTYNDEDIERNDGSLLFDLSTIKYATNNFSEENKLGEGGFGPVYKGTFTNSQEIAVKRLSKHSQQGIEQLRNEVVLLAKLQHKNLVKLFGFCLDGSEKLLVFEYLSNTSLDNFLFDPLKSDKLDWNVRLNIIEGVARGLVYLHEDSRLKIVHRDLKASNILLDDDMNPKISDFGLAKLFQNIDETHANTSRIAGTYGYMAPEYAMQGQFSTKSDVYSYGILVLEILTGKSSNYTPEDMDGGLLSYVWRHWKQGEPLEAIDKNITGPRPAQELIRCIHIGLLCVQEDPSQRPNMASVLHMIRSPSMTIAAPSPPPTFFHSSTISAGQTSQTENYSMATTENAETGRVATEDMRISE